jgi:uncharacterized protein YbjT (DUF2867 family)
MTAVPDDRLVTVFGGSGFIGRHLVRALARSGWRIRVAARRPDLAFHLQPLGRVGQIHAVQANLRFADSVQRAAEGADAIINLVGILHKSGKQTFDAVQAQGANQVAKAAAANGAKLSAVLGDRRRSEIEVGLCAQQGRGRRPALAAVPDAVIVRPSIVFGPEDHFFNRFAAMATVSPFLPLIGGGKTRFQPVFVGDVAAAVDAILAGRAQPGATYELGGPEVRTFEELMQLMLRMIDRKRLLVPIPLRSRACKPSFSRCCRSRYSRAIRCGCWNATMSSRRKPSAMAARCAGSASRRPPWSRCCRLIWCASAAAGNSGGARPEGAVVDAGARRPATSRSHRSKQAAAIPARSDKRQTAYRSHRAAIAS